jgi:hypothetical protein
MPQTENTLLSVMDRLPPYQVRLLALDGRKPISTLKLAQKSGLSPFTIKSLARAETWIGYELSTIIAFTNACNVDLLKQKYARQKISRWMRSNRPPPHLSTRQMKYWNSIFSGEKNWRKPAE